MIGLSLDWPPTVNLCWRHGAGKVFLSEEVRAYRKKHAWLAKAAARGERFHGPVRVEMWLYPPDRRRRDIDNVLKCTFDTITDSGIWDDDYQVEDLHIRRMAPEAPGRVEVTINAAG